MLYFPKTMKRSPHLRTLLFPRFDNSATAPHFRPILSSSIVPSPSPSSQLTMVRNDRSRIPSLRTSTMLSNHARAQVTSSSPLIQQRSRKTEALSNEDRRISIAGLHSHDADYPTRGPRVEKSTTHSRKRHGNSSPALVQNFNSQVCDCSITREADPHRET